MSSTKEQANVGLSDVNNADTAVATKNTATTKLERRRRIEELHEAKLLREESDDFLDW